MVVYKSMMGPVWFKGVEHVNLLAFGSRKRSIQHSFNGIVDCLSIHRRHFKYPLSLLHILRIRIQKLWKQISVALVFDECNLILLTFRHRLLSIHFIPHIVSRWRMWIRVFEDRPYTVFWLIELFNVLILFYVVDFLKEYIILMVNYLLLVTIPYRKVWTFI